MSEIPNVKALARAKQKHSFNKSRQHSRRGGRGGSGGKPGRANTNTAQEGSSSDSDDIFIPHKIIINK